VSNVPEEGGTVRGPQSCGQAFSGPAEPVCRPFFKTFFANGKRGGATLLRARHRPINELK
jgi:hypothetical protein